MYTITRLPTVVATLTNVVSSIGEDAVPLGIIIHTESLH